MGLVAMPVLAQEEPPRGIVQSITITGNQRIETDTIRTYVGLNLGDPYDDAIIDAAFKRLFATGLFADATIRAVGGAVEVTVVENPIINRVVLDGNRALKDDKLREEIRLAPRQVYTLPKVRADVQRIIELYRRSGRFAAIVEPKIIELEQNRVDLVFEIAEGEKTGVAKINFIGNRKFSDGDLRSEIATRQSRWWNIFTSNDTYDPDRLAYDRELLRQYYLTEGYADFRVISAVAELTPNREDFFITFTIEEGEVYDFGKIDIESEIRDLKPDQLRFLLIPQEGKRYNARLIENTIEALTNTAGLLGYAFVDIRPRITRDRENRKMNVTFRILEAPRVYVERINIYGNVRTQDNVIRREFRLQEGDPFNSSRVERSKQRIQSLGFFQDQLEIEQVPGSAPDKVILEVNLEEKATGELSLGAGFSSLENFLFDFSIRERNFLGKGQDLNVGFTWSSRRRQINLSFTEPYFLDRNLAAGFDLFRTEFNNRIESSFEQTSTGMGLRAGFPLTEFFSMGTRYTLRQDQVRVPASLQPFVSPFILAAIGNRTTSSVGYSLIYDTLNNRLRPSRGQRAVFSQDVAGLGGSEKYVRNRIDYDIYNPLWDKWILRFGLEAGAIYGIGQGVRLNNRFFLGGPRIRGFKIRGIGPRDARLDRNGRFIGDALGGNLYYIGQTELEVPLGDAANELGIRASAFVDVGSLWSLDLDPITGIDPTRIRGNTPKPRLAVGVGVGWNSPFGPFRIDLGRAILKDEVDQTEFFQFNIGTQF
ncbi:MAG: outer membrane protein assembly factor BamA [Pseudomonadota bacterium]